MKQYISWKKSYLISILVHIALLFVLGIVLVTVVAPKQEENAFEIDMDLSEMQAGGGGGGGGSPFAAPLTQEALAAKEAAVHQSALTPQTPVTPAAEDADTVKVPDASNTSNTNASSNAASNATGSTSGNATGNGGGGSGTGSGGGNGSGVGTGNGSGTGSGSGSGSGSGHGAGVGSGTGNSKKNTAPFDYGGFQATVQSIAEGQYPQQALKRNITGTVRVSVTVSASGSVSVGGASGAQSVLNNAAASAVRAVGHYPNGTGESVTFTVPVHYNLTSDEDEE